LMEAFLETGAFWEKSDGWVLIRGNGIRRNAALQNLFQVLSIDNSDPATFPTQGNEILPFQRSKMFENGGWGTEPYEGPYLSHGGQLALPEEEQDRFQNGALLLCEGLLVMGILK